MVYIISNIDYLLFSGGYIPLDCGLSIKQYSIKDINENGIGYKRYESIIWSLTRYTYEFKFDLEDIGVDHTKLDEYDIFLMLIRQRSITEVIEDLNYLFDDKFSIEDGFFVSKNGSKINRDSIGEIKKTLSDIMFFKKPKERIPANESAKKLIKRQIKMQKNKKVEYDIYSIMYAVVLSPNSSETYETMLNRTPHQIYASYLNIKKQKDFDNTMSGIYSGVIKSADIDFNKINWINKIN